MMPDRDAPWEEAGLEERGCPLLADRVRPTVGEDDVHAREIAVVAVSLQRPGQRVGSAGARRLRGAALGDDEAPPVLVWR
jgi:hypothetical protein